ncbi:MAG: hypothetical protein ACRBG0_19345 [Lewinella sp.]|uniref:hypothetical protein n=1 Tax=Lewinella sp. TaxID=2004506 RepID=UPI003D6BC8BB
MNTETIDVGNRKYEFFVSAAVAKRQTQYLLDLQGDSEDINVDQMIDVSLDLLHEGLVSARKSQPLAKRMISDLFKPIPSRERLPYLVDFKKAQSLMMGEQKETEEKAPK